jgi:hypothetical protein
MAAVLESHCPLSRATDGSAHTSVASVPDHVKSSYKLILPRYEAYYNNWLGGKYLYRIQKMHEQYGPIIRISPCDLHVGDPVSSAKSVVVPICSSRHRISTIFFTPVLQADDEQTNHLV